MKICSRHHILIVEDNPYGLLGFDGDPIPAIQSFNPDGVVYLGSFSKPSRRATASAGRSHRLR